MAVTPYKRDNVALADCLASDGVGSVVYIRGALVGGRFQVETADPSDFSKMPGTAMIIAKSGATECWIQFRGQVIGVYSGLTPGEMLFVDDNGLLTDDPPDPTLAKPFMFTQSIGVALSTDIIGLDPDTTLTRRRM